MKRKYIYIVFIIAFGFLCVGKIYVNRTYTHVNSSPANKDVVISASRVCAPAGILPLTYKDLKIVAENSTPDNMGIVQAFDLNTNRMIWSKRVYLVGVDPNIEEDTQLIFIKEMRIENDRLVVIDEHLRKYTLDPDTGKEITLEAAQ